MAEGDRDREAFSMMIRRTGRRVGNEGRKAGGRPALKRRGGGRRKAGPARMDPLLAKMAMIDMISRGEDFNPLTAVCACGNGGD